jgi:hypothetical protein
MHCKRFLICLFVTSVLTVALGQDVLTTEPTHYRLMFENEFVRVINVYFGPHDKTGMYFHRAGVIVAVTAGHIKFMDDNGKIKISSYLPGDARWVQAVRHTAENLEDSGYGAIFIEIKADTRMGASSPPNRKNGTPGSDGPTQETIRRALSSFGLFSLQELPNQ